MTTTTKRNSFSEQQENSAHGLKPFLRKDRTPKGIYIMLVKGKVSLRADYKSHCPSRVQIQVKLDFAAIIDSWFEFVYRINQQIRLTVSEYVQLKTAWERLVLRYDL